jgi:hypothetical protein
MGDAACSEYMQENLAIHARLPQSHDTTQAVPLWLNMMRPSQSLQNIDTIPDDCAILDTLSPQ